MYAIVAISCTSTFSLKGCLIKYVQMPQSGPGEIHLCALCTGNLEIKTKKLFDNASKMCDQLRKLLGVWWWWGGGVLKFVNLLVLRSLHALTI